MLLAGSSPRDAKRTLRTLRASCHLVLGLSSLVLSLRICLWPFNVGCLLFCLIMKTEKSTNHFYRIVLIISLLTITAGITTTALAQSPPNIGVSGYVSGDNVRRGRSAQALVVMDIPSGFHVHSNRPLEKFLIATQLQIEAPNGVRVGSVIYPRPIMRTLKFSRNRVAVFEGRTMMRFNVTVPASFGSDSAQLKARLRYQSCNDELCFAPQTKEVTINVKVN